MSIKRLCVVTGASRGIGRAICQRLVNESPDVRVVMCVRQAMPFDAEGGRVVQMALDVTNTEQVEAAAGQIKELLQKDERLTLINNAGLGEDLPWDKCADPTTARRVLSVNLLGVKRVTDSLLPLLKDNGIVVNVSSGAAGQNVRRSREDIQEKLLGDMTWPEISTAADTFVTEYEAQMAATPAEMPQMSGSGFWLQGYGFSKALLNAYTRLLWREHAVVAHCCTPGFVATDMVKKHLEQNPNDTLKPPQEGAATPVFLALGGAEGATAPGFYRDCAEDKDGWIASPPKQ